MTGRHEAALPFWTCPHKPAVGSEVGAEHSVSFPCTGTELRKWASVFTPTGPRMVR